MKICVALFAAVQYDYLGDLYMSKTDILETMQNHLGPQFTFSLQIRGSAVDVILFTNPTAKFYASAHTHSGHEFHYIQSGSSCLRIGNTHYPMTPETCYLVAKGTFHDIKMQTDSICRLSALIIPRDSQSPFGDLPPFTAFGAEGNLQQILKLLLAALSHRQNGDFESYVHACVTMLLIELLGCLFPETSVSPAPEKTPALINRSLESVKQEILSYMANNLATASMEELAALLHMSPRQTARFLQEKLGDTFSSLLRKHRIECAKGLMLSGNLSLEEIAFLSGYNSYKGFHSAFCKYTGVNPKAYKEGRC